LIVFVYAFIVIIVLIFSYCAYNYILYLCGSLFRLAAHNAALAHLLPLKPILYDEE